MRARMGAAWNEKLVEPATLYFNAARDHLHSVREKAAQKTQSAQESAAQIRAKLGQVGHCV